MDGQFFSFITSQINEYSIKSYNEDSYVGCFLKVDVQYPEKSHNDLLILLKKMKI